MAVAVPFNVRKKLGLTKPGEVDPLAVESAPAAGKTESAPAAETKTSVAAETKTSPAPTTGAVVGVAADPALLKEINQRLQLLETAMKESYYEEPYLAPGTYEYESAGIREKNGKIPAWIAAVWVFIIVTGIYFLFTNIL